MSKEVRNIFLALIGTALFILLSSIFIEMININTSSIQLRQNVRLACDKALDLFAQESYKVRSDYSGASSGTIETSPIKDENGNIVTMDKFYFGTDEEDIYRNLYDTSRASASDFKDWCDNNASNWQSVSLLYKYINDPSYFTVTTMPQFNNYYSANPNNIELAFQLYESDMALYTEYAVAKSYYDTRMTPMNLGVPYFDQKTVERMFRWNLAQILSNCSSSMIKENNLTGEHYVLVDGFRVYFNTAKITSIDYKVYDLSDTTSDESGLGARGFKKLTGIDATSGNLGFSYDVEYLGTSYDERQRVCVANIGYTVDIEYEGITPIKRIFSWIWTNEVDGYTGNGSIDTTGFSTSWVDTREQLVGGDTAATPGHLPVPGKLLFYLVR